MNIVQKLLRNSAVKYAIVGGINTLVCWVVIFVLMWGGVIPEIANAIGYGVGIIVSYVLNKRYTFASKRSHREDFVRFCVAMGIAYGVNFIVLVVLYRGFGVNEYFAQIIAAVFYTISGYLISKIWAFKPKSSH